MNVKVYLTRFVWDGIDYEGPSIVAKTRIDAELVCEDLGCFVVGELTDVVVAEEGHGILH